MSNVFSYPESLRSPHDDEIKQILYSKRLNMFIVLSSKLISFWNSIDFHLIASVTSFSNFSFQMCCIIGENILAVLSDKNQTRFLSIGDFSFLESILDLQTQEQIVYFKKSGKYIMAIAKDGEIFYISTNLKIAKARRVNIPAPIKYINDTGTELYILFENGQIAKIFENDFLILATPTAKYMVLEKYGKYALLYVNRNEWQMWELKTLSFVQTIPISTHKACISPAGDTVFFFRGCQFLVYINCILVDKIDINIDENSEIVTSFDSIGQSLLVGCSKHLYVYKMICASSKFSVLRSVPISNNYVQIPFKDELVKCILPKHIEYEYGVICDMCLAIVTSNGFMVLPFPFPAFSQIYEGSNYSQIIKNIELKSWLKEKSKKRWIKCFGLNIKSICWNNGVLYVLLFDASYSIMSYRINANDLVMIDKFELSGEPLFISASSSNISIVYSNQISFLNIETKSLVTGFRPNGYTIRCAFYVNNDILAIHNSQMQLVLYFNDKVLYCFDDVLSFQLTGSNAWPLMIFGEKLRLVCANNDVIVLDKSMYEGLIIGIDGFSLLSIKPFLKKDFSYLIIYQSIVNDSIASALSILSQVSDNKKVDVLKRIGGMLYSSIESKFLLLLERFPSIQDDVLSSIVKSGKLFDMKDFWSFCFSRGWYKTCSQLIPNSTIENCISLIIKTEFDSYICREAQQVFPELFNQNNIVQYLGLKYEDELMQKLKKSFQNNDFVSLADLVKFFPSCIRRFLLQTRRERYGSIWRADDTINGLNDCTRQQIIDLSVVFEDTLSFEYLFCSSYCLRNFAKCIECIEKQHRITIYIDKIILDKIGYLS